MAHKDVKIHIIGAGVSGLAAALTLKKAGYNAQVLEQAATIGGRVNTTINGAMKLDHGFQVLLDHYPAAQEFLNLDSLDLVKFSPASVIYIDGKKHVIGDAQRDMKYAWKTIVAGVGSVSDKWKVYTLSRKLKQKNLIDIFKSPEKTTLQYLQDYGFSEKMIKSFFKPFYSGIFLETQLQTSSRMFEFVFKMFSEGNATIPAAGIKAIPEQMAHQLDGQIQLNTTVKEVVADTIQLVNGDNLKSDYTIIATPADVLVPNLPKSNKPWHSVQTLYFDTDDHGFDQPIIGLIAGDDCLSNNFHFLNDVFENHPKVISVSVVAKHDLTKDQLEERVRKELIEQAHIKAGDLIQMMEIKKALPTFDSIQYAMSPTETQLTQNIFLAGDQLSNGSLNAAMLNGKAAAQAVISNIENGIFV
ncbi:FAD-dependent oxidoreductase [Nonlabens sp. Asnod3-H03]|uniref:FAD-dependent oxidoreductase n=1 Tax=Nonlabens sp. Asnod3-H03 TaxID=3160580 RepID=UPI00386FF856